MSLISCLAPAGPTPDLGSRCATRYPIVLLHGLGYRDDMTLLSSWNRIPDYLAAGGAKVFLGGLQAWAAIETNAAALVGHIDRVLVQTGAAKVNLIAHSKGGLEARYAISRLGIAAEIASLTTLCTPHHGTAVADVGNRLPGHLAAEALVDLMARWMGDATPDSEAAIRSLSRPAMAAFNAAVPDAEGVLYQSWGTMMRSIADDPLFALTHEILSHAEGDNDGMVSASSCRWGEFQGLIQGPDPHRGISHLQMVDFCRRDVAGVDIPMVYVGIAEGLKTKGF